MALSRYICVMENLLLGMEMFNFKCSNALIFESITLQRKKFVLTFNLNVIHSSKHLTRLKLTFLMTVKDFEHFIHVGNNHLLEIRLLETGFLSRFQPNP
jgi:hypothetical protein